jgi:hypothetical protein
MGGYDGGTELGLMGNWNENRAATFAILETAKKAASESESSHCEFDMDGRMYTMQAASVGSGGFSYKYVFVGDGVKYYVHSNAKKNIQPVRLVYMAKGLIGCDFFHKHSRTMGVLGEMGFSVTEEKLTRFDMQVMLPMTLQDLFGAADGDKSYIVCPAQKENFHRKNGCLQTFTMGDISSQEVCIYDKRSQMIENMLKSDPDNFDLMIQHCFGKKWLEEETPCTRIEFRFGRKLLKAMNINSVDDLLTHEKALAHYACHSWFRIVKEPKKKGHTHEQEVSDSWKQVQEAFAKYFPGAQGHNEEGHRDDGTEIKTTPTHLEKQATGCLATAASLLYGMNANIEEVVGYCFNIISKNAEKIFAKQIERSLSRQIKGALVGTLDYRNAMDLRASILKGLQNTIDRIAAQFRPEEAF